VEFLPSSRANAEPLFAAFLAEAARGGVMAADFYGYHGQTREWLQEVGFRMSILTQMVRVFPPDSSRLTARVEAS